MDEFWEMFFPRKRAEYKIEVIMKPEKEKRILARVDFWISGRWSLPDGGMGDAHMAICGYEDCEHLIPPEAISRRMSKAELDSMGDEGKRRAMARLHTIVCPTCERPLIASAEVLGYRLEKGQLRRLSNSKALRNPETGKPQATLRDCILMQGYPSHLAEILARYWERLKGKADIMVKRADISLKQLYSQGKFVRELTGGMLLEEEWIIYEADRLAKDAASSSLAKRIAVFLGAVR